MTGGGSGGHITPVLAVARALKHKRPDVHVIYVAPKGDKLSDIVEQNNNIDEVRFIMSGKWRRYNGEGWRQFFDIKTIAKNTGDFFRVICGTLQAYRLLGKLKPDSVLVKGLVPIGWAARLKNIPYVTLDLDALPSLANRLVAKHASFHAVGAPKQLYNYPQTKTFYTGIPISEAYEMVTPQLQSRWRKDIGLDSFEYVILATGGGLGAVRLNQAIASQIAALLKLYPDLALVHVVGRDHEDEMKRQYTEVLSSTLESHVIVKGFISDMYKYSGAADLIISRAGATSLAELSAQAKACIIVPNPLLTSGHQLKNAEQLAAHGAIDIVHEDQLSKRPEILLEHIEDLLSEPSRRASLGKTLHGLAHSSAAENVADLLLRSADKQMTPEHEAAK